MKVQKLQSEDLYLVYIRKNDGWGVAVHHIGINLILLNKVNLKAMLKHKIVKFLDMVSVLESLLVISKLLIKM